jgi:hypothetical protein
MAQRHPARARVREACGRKLGMVSDAPWNAVTRAMAAKRLFFSVLFHYGTINDKPVNGSLLSCTSTVWPQTF